MSNDGNLTTLWKKKLKPGRGLDSMGVALPFHMRGWGLREGLIEKMTEERIMRRSGWQMNSAKEKSSLRLSCAQHDQKMFRMSAW